MAGDNFGSGSSREHAPWALIGWGIRAVISTSFADIFRNNAIKNGLLPVVVDAKTQRDLFALTGADPSSQVTIDLAAQTLSLPGGQQRKLSARCVQQALPAGRHRPAWVFAATDAFDQRVRAGAQDNMMADKVFLYDTTLRDGTQREGISLSVQDKLKIAQRLDDFGVRLYRGRLARLEPEGRGIFRAHVRHAFQARATSPPSASTLKKGSTPENDANLQALLATGTPVVTLVGKSWDLHVTDVLETTLEENLAMIADSVAYLKAHGREVMYDAEHFFDGYKANPEYALRTLFAAAESGADFLVLCDTNGGSLPWEVEALVERGAVKMPCPPGHPYA